MISPSWRSATCLATPDSSCKLSCFPKHYQCNWLRFLFQIARDSSMALFVCPCLISTDDLSRVIWDFWHGLCKSSMKGIFAWPTVISSKSQQKLQRISTIISTFVSRCPNFTLMSFGTLERTSLSMILSNLHKKVEALTSKTKWCSATRTPSSIMTNQLMYHYLKWRMLVVR